MPAQRCGMFALAKDVVDYQPPILPSDNRTSVDYHLLVSAVAVVFPFPVIAIDFRKLLVVAKPGFHPVEPEEARPDFHLVPVIDHDRVMRTAGPEITLPNRCTVVLEGTRISQEIFFLKP